MFGTSLSGNPLFPYARLPGVIDETGQNGVPTGSPPNSLPATGAPRGAGSFNITPQSRYGMRPDIYGGGAMSQGPAAPPQGPMPAAAPQVAAPQGGMFAGGGHHYKGLFPGKDWKTIVPMIGNAIQAYLAYSTGNPAAMETLRNSFQMQREQAEEARKLRMPQQVGDSIVQLNQQTGQYDSLYRDPQPFEAYAASMGLKPGSPEYADAVQNYRLGSWSDDALAAKTDLTGYRYDRQGQLIDQRYDRSDKQLGQRLDTQRDIAAGHDATSRSNTHYRVDNPAPHYGRSGRAAPLPTPSTVVGGIMDKQRRGEALTPAEQNTLKDYRTHYKPQRGAVQVSPNESIAHGPNGVQAVMRGGRWVDVATGKPIQ